MPGGEARPLSPATPRERIITKAFFCAYAAGGSTQMHSTTSIACALVILLVTSLTGSRNALASEHYRIVPGESELRVLVFRSGSLARFGHNHVVSSTALSGTVTAGDTAAGNSLDIHLSVASLVVDDARVRAEEGGAFSAEVSEKEAAGTRRNMLGPGLLQASEFDVIRVSSRSISGDFPDLKIEAEITIRGSRHVVQLPAFVERYGDRIVASGSKEIAHSELGLSPLTAAFGTVRVGERMTFKYRIVASKVVPASPATGQIAAGGCLADYPTSLASGQKIGKSTAVSKQRLRPPACTSRC